MFLQPAARQFARRQAALQIEIHRPYHQQRIGGRPRARLDPDQRIFKGTRAQRRQTVVDAADIALQQAALRGRQRQQGLFGAGAETVQAVRAVGGQRARAEQLGQLAGADPAQQIHLKKTVLRLHETAGIGDVEPVAAADQRHPARVARHADGAAQAGRGLGAVQPRQAGAQEQAQRQRGQGQQASQRQQQAQGPHLDRIFWHKGTSKNLLHGAIRILMVHRNPRTLM